VFLAGLEFG